MPLLSTFGAASTRSFGGIGAAAAGGGLDIDECFSCHLYNGTGSSQAINNGIDLSNEGGLVWIKSRATSDTHLLFDTIRGTGKYLISHETDQEATNNQLLSAFNSNGFSLGTDNGANQSTQDYVAWSFRKSKGFFDVVKITGDGTSGRNISHNLGQKPGMIIGTRYDANFEHWHVYHRAIDSTNPSHYAVQINRGNARQDESSYWNDTEPTSTQFTVGNNLNHSGGSFIFYLFAHNDGDGGFGPDGDKDVIKCGSYTGNTSTKPTINLGFEPQWLMLKNVSSANQDWHMVDTMRGWYNGTGVSGSGGVQDARLRPNASNAEETTFGIIDITPTGFKIGPDQLDETNKNGDTIIYIAIRRGPLAVPEDATKVFGIDKYEDGSGDGPTNGIVNDFSLLKAVSGSGNWLATSRLQGPHRFKTDNNSAEAANSNAVHDRMDGVWNTNLNNNILWGWKRAPSYFDVVAFTKTTSGAQNVSHNLGAVPEMMWIKVRNDTDNWTVYHKDLGNDKRLLLNTTDAATGSNNIFFNNTTPTASQFTIGSIAANSYNFISYLFATAAGVSKVGSYTGNGSSQNIDCGFSGGTGARFVLIKNADATGSWVIFDTTRGLVAGNDNYLRLDVNNAQGGGYDFIDPLESGFTINQTGGVVLNESGETYIFYAIA